MEQTAMAHRLKWNMRWRLSVLWFLEWGISGTILTYLPIYWASIKLTELQQGQLLAVSAVGLWLAPFLVGQVADRWMAAEKYLALSHFIGGITLFSLAAAGERYRDGVGSFQTLLFLCGLYAAAYIPTVPLVSALCFRHLPDPDSQFGKVRVWGTVGWMLAGASLSMWLEQVEVFGWLNQRFADSSWVPSLRVAVESLPRPVPSDCFRMAALLSFALSSFTVFLPATPPIRSAHDRFAPLAVLGMFKQQSFSLFIAASFLLAVLIVPLYNLAVPSLLAKLGYRPNWVPTVMLIGQISEFPALLLLSFCLKRMGLKFTFAIGIAAWAVRYGIFSIGTQSSLVLLGLGLHGICHVFLVIVAQLYMDSQCRKDLRASAQNLLTFITLGIGSPLGSLLGGALHEWLATEPVLLFLIPATASVVLLIVFWKLFHIPPVNSESDSGLQSATV
jgi:hypothetical protein